MSFIERTAMADHQRDITDLEQLLDRIVEAASDREQVSFDDVLDLVGRRSFGPMLLLAGVITSLPVVGDIPGVPILMGLFVILVSVQMLFRRDHMWLPQWLLRRSVSKEKLCKAVSWGRKPARFVDKLLRPRLRIFTHGVATYVIAATCMAISLLTPVMELIPFSANVAGAALTAFGLGLIAHDGLLAAIAFVCTAGVAGLIIYNFLL